jgi:hypothetical protein
MSRLLYVAVGCNDPVNGQFDGRAYGLTFRGRGWSVDFDHDDFERGQSFKVEQRQGVGVMIFGHAHFPFVASREWSGNWCVNEYAMKRPAGLRLLHYINRHKDWSLSGGDLRVFDWLMGLYERRDYLPWVAVRPVSDVPSQYSPEPKE